MLNEAKISRHYDLWSKIYDHTFGRLLVARQRRAIAELHLQPGDRVLDLGIGTGMTLLHYPRDVEVVGLDLSGGMLQRARQKVHEGGMSNVQLIQADALATPFADASFDHILITHVISVVSDPLKLLAEAARLLKPEGRVVVLNHFQSGHRAIAAVEKIVNPLCVHLGWRSDLSLAEAVHDAPLAIRYQFKLSAMDLWQIVVLGDRLTAPPSHEPARLEVPAGDERLDEVSAMPSPVGIS
jgi:phosphatidylethanolamine/phosphatidyl-N-methylethanolamine N-methyltransferase